LSEEITVESLVGTEERCVHVGIKRLPAEVRNIEIVPGRELVLPLKRRLGIVADCNDGSVQALHLNAIWLEDGSLCLTGKFHRDALSFRLGVEDDVFQIVRLAFRLPYLSGNGGGNRHGLYSAPALQTAVRLENEIQEIIHRELLSIEFIFSRNP